MNDDDDLVSVHKYETFNSLSQVIAIASNMIAIVKVDFQCEFVSIYCGLCPLEGCHRTG